MHRGSVVSSSSDAPVNYNPDFDSSVRIIAQKQNLTHAIEETEAVARSLAWFTSEQSLALWDAAEYLLHHEASEDARRGGAKLLEAISCRQDLAPPARRLIFDAIVSPSESDVIAARVQSLIALSDHGRKLDFTTSSVLPIVSSWIVPLYTNIAANRAKMKKGKSLKPSELVQDEATFGDLFQFAVDLVTLQRRSPTTEEIEILLSETFAICRKTSVATDIKNSLAIFDAVISYASVPDASFLPLLEVLCSIHVSVRPLSGPTSRAVRSLAKSTKQGDMIDTLHQFLRESCTEDHPRNLVVHRGALYAFSDLVRAYGQAGLPEVSFDRLVDSLSVIAKKDDGRVDADILDLCLTILESDYNRVSLAFDWTAFVDLLLLCSRRLHVEHEDSVASPTSPSHSHVKSAHDDIKSHILANVIRITSMLESLWGQLSKEQKQQAIRFLARNHENIDSSQSELIINMMREDTLCRPSQGSGWIQHCRETIERFIQPRKQPSDIRILALDTLKEALTGNERLLFTEASALLDLLIADLASEHDLLFLESLVSFVAEAAVYADDDMSFQRLVDAIATPMKSDPGRGESSDVSTTHAPRRTSTSTLELSLGNVCAVGLVRMMIRALSMSAAKSVILFEALLRIAQSSDRPADARLTVLKLLFRLRCDSAGAIAVVSTSEHDFLMNVLGRNVEVISLLHQGSEVPPRELSMQENFIVLTGGKSFGKENPATQLSKSGPRGSISARPAKLTPPVWTSSQVQVLPEQPSEESSQFVFAYSQSGDSSSAEPSLGQGVLKVNMWVECIISILQRETDWDVYSYVLTHLGPQLSNREYFSSSIPQIKLLRSILCDQVKNESFHEPPMPTGLKKSDVAACIFDTLCMLVSYHVHFAKSEEDDLVRAFMLGIVGSWGATSRGCIQALSLCCHEIPLSVTKSLNIILDKMSKIITMSNIAVHILEFLALLARLPDVYVNLREEEIRTVFGICIRFLQTSREQEQRYKASESPGTRNAQQAPQKAGGLTRDSASIAGEATEGSSHDAMSKYIMTLTYHVMVFWYLSLKLQDRAKHVNWITSRLIFHDEHGKEVVEEQSQVFIDLMQRVAFSDLGETIPYETFPPTPEDGPVSKRSWVVGMSIVTVETAGISGLTQLAKRQASGTTYSMYQQRTAPVLPHQATTLDSQMRHDPSRLAILPSHIMLQLAATAFPTPTVMQPIPVPEDDITRRAIANFDRTDIVDGHRIGIVYLDRGQSREAEILANTAGSADYEYFLSGLGTKVSLRNAQFNTQGLYADTDGEATYAWRDRVTEIVYHVATMMPTDFDRDPHCINKKRNIGNNFVTIVFNRSNLPFNFDTIPSEFNSINIVITPCSKIAYDESGALIGESDPEKLFYTVKVMSKPGYPDVSPAATPKVISGKNLAPFVRILALNASVFSLVWNNKGGEHASSWRTRLREIKKVRERALAAQAQNAETAEGAYPGQRRNTKPNIFSEDISNRPAQVQTDFASEWNAASGTNILQNLDFSRWSR
ncbi:Uncharacterized protein PECH_002960 [Penicillium ucsense]|uniref:Rap-GAP domain-containing protein n=1 Tax=Penicillium ucsense TaxID=2839758 RepID=A0A8J8W3X8_9EURO|nr:Uncharacterized protein PECM_003927 [Penicillium ucsense]KAF7737784.1 Uncharacterized protein PECH_002960 [Penicillium ucsense]